MKTNTPIHSVSKKLLILALPISLLAPAVATAADASATASAEVIEPIQITKAADLIFGDFAPGTGGTVTVATDGARTSAGPVLSTAGVTPTAARFDIVGEASATYAITYSGDTELTHTTASGVTMSLSRHSDLDGSGTTSGEVSSGTLDVSGTQSIYVGGALVVGPTQQVGSYDGTITVTVEYN